MTARRVACVAIACLGLLAAPSLGAATVPAAAQTPAQTTTLTTTAQTTALATAQAGGIGLRLVDVPADTSDDPRARTYIVDHLAPGTVVSRRIELTNTTGSTRTVALYPAAATIENGAFLGSAGRTPNDASHWTSVVPALPDVPAGGAVTAMVTIAVPRDAAPGEVYGVVWAEARSGGDGGIVQVNRVGIRMYLSIGPGGPPAADFTIDSLTAARSSDGRPTVLASVHNTGGRALDMSGTMQLSAGPSGLNAGPFPVTLGTTLEVGGTEPVTITLGRDVPAGPWTSRITLRSGLLERSVQATITFPDAGRSVPVHIDGRPGWLYSVGAGAALLLVAAALVAFARRAAQRKRPDPRH